MIENPLTIEEVEILIQALKDWYIAEKNEEAYKILTEFDYIKTQEDLDKSKNKLEIKRIKLEEAIKQKEDLVILIQAKLIKLKKEILGSAFDNLK